MNVSSNIKAAANKLLLNANGIYVEVRAVTLRRNKNFQAEDSQMPFQMLRSQPTHRKET